MKTTIDVRTVKKQKILELIDNDSFTVHFQSVFSARGGSVYGCESLARIKEDSLINIGGLFKDAIATGIISLVDVICRENAMKEAASQGINQSGLYLFINVCPETLIDPAHRLGITDELAERYCIQKEKIILELTEETAIKDYLFFKETVAYYRRRGYKIAIDDFGSGYGSLKMLSIIEPDFVKIDRYFISNIDSETVKLNLVDSIATACHRMGIKVIAEGIETGEELNAVSGVGVELLQGYYLSRPSPDLDKDIVRTMCLGVCK
jgi:EAL domain-containing protein (putative c-di-GMP-specific phosphodiesterase class I)